MSYKLNLPDTKIDDLFDELENAKNSERFYAPKPWRQSQDEWTRIRQDKRRCLGVAKE